MKNFLRLLPLVITLLALGAPEQALATVTQYYVSNAASNGYAIGNDSNNCTAKATPCLTANRVEAIRASGDQVYINPSTTPYIENTSTTGMTFTNPVAYWGGDPALVTSVGIPTILGLSGTSTRWGNINTSASAYNLSNFVMDCSGSAGTGLVFHNQTSAGVTLTNVHITNNTASGGMIGGTSTGNVFNLVDIVQDSSDTAGLIAAGNATTIAVKGGTFAGLLTVSNFPGAGNTVASFTIGKDVSGNRPQFTGTGLSPITFGAGTTTSFTMDSADFSNTFSGVLATNSATVTINTWSITNSTYSGTFAAQEGLLFSYNLTSTSGTFANNVSTASGGLIQLRSENQSNLIVHDNVAIQPTTGTNDVISVIPGAGYQAYNNKITSAATTALHMILTGTDGNPTDTSNSGGVVSAQNLGDVSGNTFVDELFTSANANRSGREAHAYGVTLQLKKAGSPTGNITCGLYANNAGVPGSLIEASTTTLAATSLTSSYQNLLFILASNSALSVSTVYHFRCTYSGAINGTDYVVMEQNSSGTGSFVVLTSTDGSSWTTQTGKSLYYSFLMLDTAADSLIHDNVVNVTSPRATAAHCVMLGSMGGGSVYRNQIHGCGIPTIAKDGYNAVFYNNIMFTDLSNSAGFYNKSGTATTFVHNTIVFAGGDIGIAIQNSPETTAGVNFPVGSGTIEDNIIMAYFGSGTNYVINLAANPIGQIANSSQWVQDYNIIYNGANTQIEKTTYHTWAAWQGAGFDTHSLNVDPVLTNEVSPSSIPMYMPTATSPAIGAGVVLSSYLTDYFGFAFGAAPDIGPFAVADYYNFLAVNGLTNNPHNMWMGL